MAALFSAFAEYIFKFVVYLAVAGIGIFAGIKIKASKQAKKPEEQIESGKAIDSPLGMKTIVSYAGEKLCKDRHILDTGGEDK